jgi:DNA-binding MarR family transcriptional regulator
MGGDRVVELNTIIHQQVRLRIMSALAALDDGDEVDFSYLKKQLGLTDGNLGAHLAKLEDAGYILIRKHFVARKPRTDVSLTLNGRAAFLEHVAALRDILG